MLDNTLDARFRAIQKLQTIRGQYPPGTYYFEVADRAIDLVLGPKRRIDSFLVSNALRDAGRIMRRRWANEPEFVSMDAPLVSDDCSEDELTLHDRLASVWFTPEQATAALDFENVLMCRLGESTPAGLVFECVARRFSGEEMAHFAGISVAYAKKLRIIVRREAKALFADCLN
jgi:hypothetical protein